jgi:hypothetical protein
MMGRLTSTAVTIATLVAGAPAAAAQTTGGPDPAIGVSSSPRNVNDPASIDGGDLYARLRELLDDGEYANFVAAAARLARTPQVRIRGIVGAIP